jgi:hypothetical protein
MLFDDNIETFSDDDEDEAFGFGQTASTILTRRRWNGHDGKLDSRAVDIVSEFQQQSQDHTTSNPEFSDRQITDQCLVSMHHQEDQSTNRKHDALNGGEDTNLDTRRRIPMNDGVASMNSTRQQHRPRRIRDASKRMSSIMKTGSTVPTMAAIQKNKSHTTNWESEYAAARAFMMSARPQRNDLVGGSGVGVGSYQMNQQNLQARPQSAPKPREKTSNSGPVNNGCDEKSTIPTRKRPTSKGRGSKKSAHSRNGSFKHKKSTRGGSNTRGRGRWRASGKNDSNRRGGSSRNGQQSAVAWSGNTDDPQLRHVGGAEMSF